MTDDLDDLRKLLKPAPAPEADAKSRAMQLAMENFDRLQGSTDPARSSEDRIKAAPQNGVRRMLKFLTSRPALAISTSAAALLIGVAVIPPFLDQRTGPVATTTETTKPKVAETEAAPGDTGDVAALTEGNTTTPPATMDASPRPEPKPELAEADLARLDAELQTALLSRDADDDRNAFLEIHASTGSD